MSESETFHNPQDLYGSVAACALGGFARLQANWQGQATLLGPSACTAGCAAQSSRACLPAERQLTPTSA